MAYLYRHIRLDKNEPFYIGIGNDNKGCYKRANSKKDRSGWWNKIINKTLYEIEIILDDLTWEQVQQKEKEFIKLYGRKDLGLGPLVNMTDGGDGVKGRIYSELEKEMRSINSKGSSNGMFGRNHTSESIAKMSEIKKQKLKSGEIVPAKHTEEHKEKVRQRMIGNKYKPNGLYWVNKNNVNKRVEKQKIQSFVDQGWTRGIYNTENYKGYHHIPWNKGKKGILISSCKQIGKYNIENELLEKYFSLTEASIRNNICESTLSQVCNNKFKTCKGINLHRKSGFLFKYIK